MLENLPIYISLIFGLITLVSIWSFYYAAQQSKPFLGFITIWTVLITVVSYSGFFQVLHTAPPRITFGVFPAVIVMVLMFLTEQGRKFIDDIDLERLTYFHTIRVPVEIVLALLAHQGAISYLQTFEGANYDILSGLTAPIIAFLYFKKGLIAKKGLLIWNITCLVLLLTIIIISILSIPGPFQQLSFDQPNIGMSYFPFILLPTIVVPLVFFGHLVAIRQLLNQKN